MCLASLQHAARCTETLTSSHQGETQRCLWDQSDPSLCQTLLQKPSGRIWKKEDDLLLYYLLAEVGSLLRDIIRVSSKKLCKFKDFSDTGSSKMPWEQHPWAVSAPGEDLALPEEKDQPRLEFANPGGGCGHIHGLLPTTKHHLQRREPTTLQRRLHHAL